VLLGYLKQKSANTASLHCTY